MNRQKALIGRKNVITSIKKDIYFVYILTSFEAIFEKLTAADSLNCISVTELAKLLAITLLAECRYGEAKEQCNGVCLFIEYAESGLDSKS